MSQSDNSAFSLIDNRENQPRGAVNMPVIGSSPENRIKIGIWGPRQSGKTTYISTLYHECLLSDSWHIKPLDLITKNFITGSHMELRRGGVFPMRSDPTETPVYRFELSHTVRNGLRKEKKVFMLEFPDPGGEWYDDYYAAKAKYPADADPMKYLLHSSALLFLIDPKPFFQKPVSEGGTGADYFKVFMDTLFEIDQHRSMLQATDELQYLALAFTKIDQQGLWERRHRLEDIAKDILETETIRQIETAFPRRAMELFAVSSVGVLDSEGSGGEQRSNIEDITLEDGSTKPHIIDTRKMKPYNVFEPLEWLIQKIRK